MNSRVDLSVEFVSATQNGGTDVNEAISGLTQSGLAQTGDVFMWAIIAAAIIVVCGALAGLMYFRKKRFATSAISSSVKHAASARGSISSVFGSLFKSTAFVIIASIFAAMLMVAGLSSTFSTSAYADGNGGLTPSTNKVIATVNADGSVSFSSISLANNTEEIFTLASSTVSITDEAKSITALSSSNFTINGFGGTVFTGNPNGQTYTAENTNKLKPAESTDLTFELIDIDKSSLESLCGKSVFTLSLKGKMAPDLPPLKDALYKYSADDLRQISDYLGSLSAEEFEQDKYYQKFDEFRNNGLTENGSDNGVDMKDTNHPNKNNHWAMDEQGRIASDSDFEVSCDATKTIQARIIGIREDVDVNGNKIGLTMMTTHALSEKSAYHTKNAAYGWSGDIQDGSCTLRTKLNDGSLFPISLINNVKISAKEYQFSKNVTSVEKSNIAYDKFWAPSMAELYGECSESSSGYWSNKNEGYQYKAFSNNLISESNHGPFVNIDKFQDDSSPRRTNVWSRSLEQRNGGASNALVIYGDHGNYGSTYVMNKLGVVACFCFGTDSSAAPTPTSKALAEDNFDSSTVSSNDIQLNSLQQLQTQQSINEPGSDVAVKDYSTQKENVNKQISPYGYTDNNTDTGAQLATGQSSGSATADQTSAQSSVIAFGVQATTDSGGIATLLQSGAVASTPQSSAPPALASPPL